MRIAFFVLFFSYGCAGARADIYRTYCNYGDAANNPLFFISADTVKKKGASDYRNPDLKAAPTNQLEVLSAKVVNGGLVGVKLIDRATGVKYAVDYVKSQRPNNSPYTKDMESVAISSPDGSTTHESCGLSK